MAGRRYSATIPSSMIGERPGRLVMSTLLLAAGVARGEQDRAARGGGAAGGHALRRLGLIVGPALFLLLLALPIPDLAAPARGVLGLTAWMAVWWFAESVPLAATALLPLVVYPLLGSSDLKGVEQSYADSAILLFLGTLLLARAISRTGLDRRIALHILQVFGGSAHRLVGGFMATCAFMSAWISATATTAIMLPVAIAVITAVRDDRERRRLSECLVLGVTYAATVGVLSTIIATPPNAVFASLAPEVIGFEVGFGQWMLIGVPTSVLMVLICWAYLVYIAAPVRGVSLAEGSKIVRERLRELGPLTRDELAIAMLFLATLVAWVSRSLLWGGLLPNVTNTTIAIAAALVAFVLPSMKGGRLLDWATAVAIPWQVLLLIGGGLALALGFTSLGIDTWIANRLEFLAAAPTLLAVAALVTLTVLVSEIMSNGATAALLIPIAASLAVTLGLSPAQLTIAVTLAASCGFMLPTSAANAIALSTGQITTRRLVRAGLPMNLLGILLVTAATLTLVSWVFG